MFPNVLTEPPSKFKVGFPSNFAPGQVETKFIPQYGVWVVNCEYNGKPEIYALRTVCTHLGCTPNWLEGEQKFKCPCHGSGFYKDGINFEGPAPRPLGALRHSHRRRRPVGSRQEQAFSGRNRPVERPCFVRRGLSSGACRPCSAECCAGSAKPAACGGSPARPSVFACQKRPCVVRCPLASRAFARSYRADSFFSLLISAVANDVPWRNDSRVAGLEEHLPASDAAGSPQSHRGDADQLLSAPAPGVDQEAGHRAVATPGAWAASRSSCSWSRR